MKIVSNTRGVLVGLSAIGIPLIVAAARGKLEDRTNRPTLYAIAILFIAFDLPLRILSYRKIRREAPELDIIITGNGPTPAPRKPSKEVLESLFSPHTGGTYFYAVPAWLAGLTILFLVRFNYLW